MGRLVRGCWAMPLAGFGLRQYRVRPVVVMLPVEVAPAGSDEVEVLTVGGR